MTTPNSPRLTKNEFSKLMEQLARLSAAQEAAAMALLLAMAEQSPPVNTH
ncbi:MAG: hypothetical protein GZ093_15635 [Rhodoferax sp.]|nr:hypothetical protein [Rhodoferax sp.]NDP40153.1 hypothetical protein [Rhodoferax sp.]